MDVLQSQEGGKMREVVDTEKEEEYFPWHESLRRLEQWIFCQNSLHVQIFRAQALHKKVSFTVHSESA
jgi:hypothetical protein